MVNTSEKAGAQVQKALQLGGGHPKIIPDESHLPANSPAAQPFLFYPLGLNPCSRDAEHAASARN